MLGDYNHNNSGAMRPLEIALEDHFSNMEMIEVKRYFFNLLPLELKNSENDKNLIFNGLRQLFNKVLKFDTSMLRMAINNNFLSKFGHNCKLTDQSKILVRQIANFISVSFQNGKSLNDILHDINSVANKDVFNLIFDDNNVNNKNKELNAKKRSLILNTLFSFGEKPNINDVQAGNNVPLERDSKYSSTKSMYDELFRNVQDIDLSTFETLNEKASGYSMDLLWASLMKFKNYVPNYVDGNDNYNINIDNDTTQARRQRFRKIYLNTNGRLCGKIFQLKIKYPYLQISEECLTSLFNLDNVKGGPANNNIHSLALYEVLVGLDETIKENKRNRANKTFLEEMDDDKSILLFKSMNLIKKLNIQLTRNSISNIKQKFKVFFEQVLSKDLSYDNINDIIENINRIEEKFNSFSSIEELSNILRTVFNNVDEYRKFNVYTLDSIKKILKHKSLEDGEKVKSLKTLYLDGAEVDKDKILLDNYNAILNADILNDNEKLCLLDDLIKNPDSYRKTLILENSIRDKTLDHFNKFIKDNTIPTGVFPDQAIRLEYYKSGILLYNSTVEDRNYFTAQSYQNKSINNLDKEKLTKIAIAQCITELQRVNFDIEKFVSTNCNTDENTNIDALFQYRRLGFLLKFISGDKLPITSQLLTGNIDNVRAALRGCNKDFLYKAALIAGKYINTAGKQSAFLANLAGIKNKEDKEFFKLIVSKFPKTGKKYNLTDNTKVYDNNIAQGNLVKNIESSFFSNKYREYIVSVKQFINRTKNEPYFKDFLNDFDLAGVNVSPSDESNSVYIDRIFTCFKLYSFLRSMNINMPKRCISSFIFALSEKNCNQDIKKDIIYLLQTIMESQSFSDEEKQKIIESTIEDVSKNFDYSFENGGRKLLDINVNTAASIRNKISSALSVISLKNLYGSSFDIKMDFFKNLDGSINLNSQEKVLQYILYRRIRQLHSVQGTLDSILSTNADDSNIAVEVCKQAFGVENLLNVNNYNQNFNTFINNNNNGVNDIDGIFSKQLSNIDNKDFVKTSIVLEKYQDMDSLKLNINDLKEDEKKYRNNINIADIDNDTKSLGFYDRKLLRESNDFLKEYLSLPNNFDFFQPINKKYLDSFQKMLNGCSVLEFQELQRIFGFFSSLKQQAEADKTDSLIKVDDLHDGQPKKILERLRCILLKKEYNMTMSNEELVLFYKISAILSATLCKKDIEEIENEQDDKKQLILVEKLINKTIMDFCSHFQRSFVSGKGINSLLSKYTVIPQQIFDSLKCLVGKVNLLGTEQIEDIDLLVAFDRVSKEAVDGYGQLLKKTLFSLKEQDEKTEAFNDLMKIFQILKTSTTKESYDAEYDGLIKKLEGLNGYNKYGSKELIDGLKKIESFCKKINDVVDIVESLKADNDFLNKRITSNNAINILCLINLNEDILNHLPTFTSSFIRGLIDNFCTYKIIRENSAFENQADFMTVNNLFDKVFREKVVNKDSFTFNIMEKEAALFCLKDFQEYNIDRYRAAGENEEEKKKNHHLLMMKERFSHLKNKIKEKVIGGEVFKFQKHLVSTAVDLPQQDINAAVLAQGERFVYKNSKGDKILIKQLKDNFQVNANQFPVDGGYEPLGDVSDLCYHLIEKQDNLVIYKKLKQGLDDLEVEDVRLFDRNLFSNFQNFDAIINNNGALNISKENNTVSLGVHFTINKHDNLSFEDFLNICTTSFEFLKVASKTGLFNENNLVACLEKIIQSLNTESSCEYISYIKNSMNNIADYRNKILFGQGYFFKYKEYLNYAILNNGNIGGFSAILTTAINDVKNIDDNFIEFIGDGYKMLIEKWFLSEVQTRNVAAMKDCYKKYSIFLKGITDFTDFMKNNFTKSEKDKDTFKRKMTSFLQILNNNNGINIETFNKTLYECQRLDVSKFLSKNEDDLELIDDDVFADIEEPEESRDDESNKEEPEESKDGESNQEEPDEENGNKNKKEEEEQKKVKKRKKRKPQNVKRKMGEDISINSIPIVNNRNDPRKRNNKKKIFEKFRNNNYRDTQSTGNIKKKNIIGFSKNEVEVDMGLVKQMLNGIPVTNLETGFRGNSRS